MQGRKCLKCGKGKEAEAFEKNGLKPDGSIRLRSICKACGSRRVLSRLEARRCSRCNKKKEAKEFRGARGSWCKECHNRWTDEYKKGAGRTQHIARMTAYNRNRYNSDPLYRLKVAARGAVRYAVRTGALLRPTRCPTCNKRCRLHGHHHMGYARKNWLNVKWVCPKCHRKEDYPSP
jgi:hypothetical protein